VIESIFLMARPFGVLLRRSQRRPGYDGRPTTSWADRMRIESSDERVPWNQVSEFRRLGIAGSALLGSPRTCSELAPGDCFTCFERKGLLPRTLKFRAALGNRDGVRAALDENGSDLKTVHEAFVAACHFGNEDVATFLLNRSIALDPELGRHIDGQTDRVSFIKAFAKSDLRRSRSSGCGRCSSWSSSGERFRTGM
jgi:hypothetical protein